MPKQTNKKSTRTTTQSTNVCMERVSSMNVEEVYLSWETTGPGVSHEADDPLNSAHRHPNKETRTKTEYGRQSGRVVTFPPIKPGTNKDPGTTYQPLQSQIGEGLCVYTYNLPQPTSSPNLSNLRTGSNI